MAQKLTARQSQVLDLIRQAMVQTGRPPTRAEIAGQLGFRSVNAAEDHLRALDRKGYIRLISGTSRGIQLTAAAGGWPAGAATAAGKHLAATSSPEHLPGGGPQPADFLENIRTLPLIGRVAAGSPILAAEHVESEIPLAPHLFDSAPDYLLRVRGSSMRDAGILDGDLLAVRSTPQARHGQIIVARLGDDVTVKRLEHLGGRIRLLPENPDFTPIQVGPDSDFAIEGIAVGLIRTGALS